MAIQCSRCGRQYDVALFQFGKKVFCECGHVVDRRDPITFKCEKPKLHDVEKENLARLQRMADRVCFLIVASDYPGVDIEIEKSKVRRIAEELFPDKVGLYEMIYEARFNRLWQQFRRR